MSGYRDGRGGASAPVGEPSDSRIGPSDPRIGPSDPGSGPSDPDSNPRPSARESSSLPKAPSGVLSDCAIVIVNRYRTHYSQ